MSSLLLIYRSECYGIFLSFIFFLSTRFFGKQTLQSFDNANPTLSIICIQVKCFHFFYSYSISPSYITIVLLSNKKKNCEKNLIRTNIEINVLKPMFSGR